MGDEEDKKSDPDVMYRTRGGDRPMREVIAEWHARRREIPKATLEQAFRDRAGIIAQLGMCLCAYPIVKELTASGHAEWCPGEGLKKSMDDVKSRAEKAR